MTDGVFVHERALCESTHIGPGTRIWAFAHVLPGARIGSDCNLCDGVFVENDVVVGDRVTVKCGVQLWDGVVLEDDVFVGPNATFCNDAFPRSRVHDRSPARTLVRRGASIGANATILPGLEVGPGAMVGAGAVVTRSVPANAVVVGNPARIIGYDGGSRGTTMDPGGPATASAPAAAPGTRPMGVGGAELVETPLFRDLRGSLTAAQTDGLLPFTPARYFLVFDVPSRDVRGEHAHRRCSQLLICLNGSCTALVDDGRTRREVVLDRPTRALHLPPMIWGTQFNYSPDCILLVLASHPYDPDDYVRRYDDYLALLAAQETAS